MSRTQVSNEELLENLRQLAERLGETPTSRDMSNDGPHSVTSYSERFGSWSAAIEAAGLERRRVTDERLIENLKSLADELGKTPTLRDMQKDGPHSSRTYQDHFGSWNEALKMAGLEINNKGKVSKTELLDELENVASRLERTPTRQDMQDSGTYGYSSYERKFGSWNKALEAAGLKKNKVHNKKRERYTCDYCGDEFDKLPSQVKGQKHTFCSRGCHGDWNSVHRRGDKHPQWNSVEAECAYCSETIYRRPSLLKDKDRVFCDSKCMGQFRQLDGNPNWREGASPQYGPNWEETRQKVLDRDGHECQDCGINSDESWATYDHGLHVHHIRPRRNFVTDSGEFRYEAANQLDNLVVLCPACHRKWEGIPLRPQ